MSASHDGNAAVSSFSLLIRSFGAPSYADILFVARIARLRRIGWLQRNASCKGSGAGKNT